MRFSFIFSASRVFCNVKHLIFHLIFLGILISCNSNPANFPTPSLPIPTPTSGTFNWPQDLGAGRNNFTSESNWSSAWSSGGPPVKWRKSVGGGGSSVIFQDGKVYVIGAYKHGSNVASGSVPAMTVSLKDISYWGTTFPPLDEWLLCLDAETGNQIWAYCIAQNVLMDFVNQPRAAPLYYEGKVFAHGQSKMLVCVDALTSSLCWDKNLSSIYSIDPRAFLNSMASPVLADGKIVVCFEVNSSLEGARLLTVAFNPDTGAEVWAHFASPFAWHYDPNTFPCETGWGPGQNSPYYAEIEGNKTVVVATGHALIGINAETGMRRWTFVHEKEFDDISPSWINWQFYLQYGYASTAVNGYKNFIVDRVYPGHGSYGSRTYAVEIVNGEPILRWQTFNLANRWTRYAVSDDGKLIGLDIGSSLAAVGEKVRDNRTIGVGQLQCIDIPTGALLWSTDQYKQLSWDGNEEGYNYFGDMEMLLAGDRLLIKGKCSYTGYPYSGLFAARITPAGITPLAAYSFWIGSAGFGGPVLANGLLFFRLTDENNGLGANGNLVCFNLRKP